MATILKKELKMYFEEHDATPSTPAFVIRVPDPRSDLLPNDIKTVMQTIIANGSVLYGKPKKALKAEIILTEKESYVEQVQA